MSQSQDMSAINDLFRRTTTKNSTATALKNSWIEWYDNLGMIARNFDDEVLKMAQARRDDFQRAQAGQPVPVRGATVPKPAVVIPPGHYPSLKKGMSGAPGTPVGEAIKLWRLFLNKPSLVPAPGSKSYDFGPATVAATKEWQKGKKDITGKALVADGAVGDLTWGAAQRSSVGVMNQAATPAAAVAQAIQAVAQAAPIPSVAASPEAVAAAAKVVSQVATASQQKKAAAPAPAPKKPDVAAVAKKAVAMVSAKPSVSPKVTVELPSLENVKNTLLQIHNTTPLWLKVTTGALAGLTALLGVEFLKGKKRAA